MGLQKILSLISDSISFFLYLHLLGIFLSVQRKKKEGSKKGNRRYFWFPLYFTRDFLTSSWTIWEPSFLSNQALKYIGGLQWLISPNLEWLCPVVFSCCLLQHVGLLAADTARMQSEGDLAKQGYNLLAAGWENVLSVWRVSTWVRVNLSLSRRWLHFFMHLSPQFLSGASGSFCMFENLFSSYLIHLHCSTN